MSPTDELAGLIDQLGKIRKEWLDRLISPQEQTGNVYHYTDAEGLLGILQSGNLRATHFLGMNDVSEVRYAKELALDAIRTLSIDAGEIAQGFLSHEAGLVDAADELATEYLICFCDHDNLLSQWREYGAAGDGFAIGFDKQSLAPAFGSSVVLLKVTYDRELQLDILRTSITTFWEVLKQHVPNDPQAAITSQSKVAAALVSRLTLQLAAIKLPEFYEEREWRIVHFHRFGETLPATKYRAGRYGIVPYKELVPAAGAKLPIKTITQGPTADRVLAKRVIEMLLSDSGFQGVKVAVSEIPLR